MHSGLVGNGQKEDRESVKPRHYHQTYRTHGLPSEAEAAPNFSRSVAIIVRHVFKEIARHRY